MCKQPWLSTEQHSIAGPLVELSTICGGPIARSALSGLGGPQRKEGTPYLTTWPDVDLAGDAMDSDKRNPRHQTLTRTTLALIII